VVEDLVEHVASHEADDEHPRDERVEQRQIETEAARAAGGERRSEDNARGHEETERVDPEAQEDQIGEVNVRDHSAVWVLAHFTPRVRAAISWARLSYPHNVRVALFLPPHNGRAQPPALPSDDLGAIEVAPALSKRKGRLERAGQH